MNDSEKTTKPCPYCGEEVLVVAIKCKHCGSEIIKSADINNNKEKPGCFKTGCLIIIGLIGVFLVVGGGLALIGGLFK